MSCAYFRLDLYQTMLIAQLLVFPVVPQLPADVNTVNSRLWIYILVFKVWHYLTSDQKY
jgi:hypothetical protein